MPPYQEFFQRALAAQIGTIQLSSSSAGLHTPLDTGMTSPLWVRGGGGAPTWRRMNRRLFPAAFRQPAEAEGGEGSKGAQLNAHLEPMPSKQLTGGWRPRACELAG